MKVAKGEVIIFKAPTDDADSNGDPYRKRLVEAGFKTQTIPVLDFEYCNLNALQKNLENPNMFSGLIFTSPRAVQAVAYLKDTNVSFGEWQHHPIFVIGEGTSKTLKKELDLDGQGSNTGNASDLANLILKNSYERPLLFPCGNLKRDELSTKLHDEGVNIVSVTVYQTKIHPQLEQRLQEITLHSSCFPEIIVYFSPSGCKFTIPILHKLEVPLDELKLVAIGPTTEAALIESNLAVWSVASRPTPEHLLEAILKYYS